VRITLSAAGGHIGTCIGFAIELLAQKFSTVDPFGVRIPDYGC
jgi:hypothetical protein